jgi:hypothetical protein
MRISSHARPERCSKDVPLRYQPRLRHREVVAGPMQLLDEASDIGSAVIVCQAEDRRIHVGPYEQA